MGFLAEFAVTRNVRKLHIAKNLVYGQVCQQHLSTDFCTSCCLFVDVLSAHQLADALKVATASAEEEDLLDDVMLVGRHVYEL